MDDAKILKMKMRLRQGQTLSRSDVWSLIEELQSEKYRAEKAEAERDAARNAALEEAAKVADMHDYTIQSSTAADLRAMQIALAIRALKGKSHE